MNSSLNSFERRQQATRATALFLAAALVLGMALGVSRVVFAAAEWSVSAAHDGTGCNAGTRECQTISAAVAAATAGDTINIANGAYTESLAIDKSLSIIGNTANPALVQINAVTPGAGNPASAIDPAADDITLKGFTLVGISSNTANTTLPRTGIHAHNFSGITIEDVVVHNFSRAGLEFHTYSNVTLTNVNIYDNGGSGLVLRLVDGATVTNITTDNNLWGGVRIQSGDADSPGGATTVSGIVFAGTNSFGDNDQRNGGLYTEQDPVGFPISVGYTDAFDVQIQAADFVFALDGTQDDAKPRVRFYKTVAQAVSAANSVVAPDHLLTATAYIVDLSDGSFYVGEGMSIQNAINAATVGSTVYVAPGTYGAGITLPAVNDLTLSGTDENVRSVLSGGMILGSASNVTLRNLEVSGSANGTAVIAGASITNFALDNVRIDGGSVSARHGIAGGNIGGNISIIDSEFVNINGWAAFDTRSGSGGATTGSDINTAIFSNNLVQNTQGHINFRGTISDPAVHVTFSANTVELGGSATNSFGAALKAFYADTVIFTDNVIKDVGTSGYNPGGEAAYGAGFMPRNVTNLTVTGNTFENNNQAIAIEPRNADPSGYPDGVLPNGIIQDNVFTGNTYGVYVGATLHLTSAFGGLEISGNSFSGNTDEAVHNGYASGTLDAENNWWGAASGPSGIGAGLGDAVSANVDFEPFCANAACTATATLNDEGQVVLPPGVDAEQLQAVLDDALPGTTIVLPAGTLEPEGGFTINVDGVTLILNGVVINPSSPCFTVEADGVSLIGGTCLPSGADHGIQVLEDVDNLLIQGMEIDGSGSSGHGIYIDAAVNDLRIVDNYIHNNADGLHYTDAGIVTGPHEVQGNLFANNGDLGVNNDSGSSYNVEYNSWGHLDGPNAGGDGASGDLDFTPWTHASLSMVSSDSPMSDQVAIGSQIKYTINLAAASVWGADFDLAFDNTRLSVVSITGNATFDQLLDCAISSVGQANASGTISFCGYAPSVVDGATVPVYEVVFEGVMAGVVSLDLDDTQDTFAMFPGYGGSTNIYASALADGSVTVLGDFTVDGRIDLQGRANDSGAVVGFGAGTNLYGPYTFGATNAQGNFSGSVADSTNYAVTVSRSHYLNVNAANGNTVDISIATTLPTLVLLGGDVNDDDVIDISDAALIGGMYGDNNAVGDINGDGVVNILDLVMVGGNYGADADSAYIGWLP